MKVLVLRQPVGTVLGVSLRWYRPGQVYDLPATLAAYLVTEGFAMVEMRSEDRRPSSSETERRRKNPDIRT
jgi:hypothetical protein